MHDREAEHRGHLAERGKCGSYHSVQLAEASGEHHASLEEERLVVQADCSANAYDPDAEFLLGQ